ncbi:hypothetical protein [Streptomyces sp. NPDC005827]|uniref:hypothetical protein n=1 Tax=Streptomyces sp. NPDC005827 TaxID=3157070 RepID=UPI0033C9ECC0
MPFFPGRIAAWSEPDDAWSAAAALGGFVDALHAPAPSAAPVSRARGIPLSRLASREAGCVLLWDGWRVMRLVISVMAAHVMKVSECWTSCSWSGA